MSIVSDRPLPTSRSERALAPAWAMPTLAVACAVLAGQTGLRAQRGGFGGFQQQTQNETKKAFEQPLIGGDAAGALSSTIIPTFALPDSTNPLYQALPVLVPPGFSAFPGGQLAQPFPLPGENPAFPAVPPVAVPRSPNAWPSWFEGEVEDGFTADVAVLVQASDLVWVKQPEDGVFLPLTHHDRFRVVEVDTRVQVRGAGQFVLVFNGGGRVRLHGETELTITELDEERITIRVPRTERVELRVGDRPFTVEFGTSGSIDALAGDVIAQRDGGVLRVENRGRQPMTLRRDALTTVVPRFHAIGLLPTPPAADADRSAGLELRGGAVSDRAADASRVLEVTAPTERGAVHWCGARFGLEPGARLRIDPLAGTTFPDHRDESR